MFLGRLKNLSAKILKETKYNVPKICGMLFTAIVEWYLLILLKCIQNFFVRMSDKGDRWEKLMKMVWNDY